MGLKGDGVLVSVTMDDLDVAGRHGFDIELDLNWEDKQYLAGEQSLYDAVRDHDVTPERIRSVHLPPGAWTRGDEIGMAATGDNIGPVNDFTHAQLDAFQDPFLVMHPDKNLSHTDQLPLLATYTELTGREIAIENTKSAERWCRPEDMAFYAWAADERDELDDLYLTVDSAHFPESASTTDLVDRDAVDAIRDEVPDTYRDAVDAYADVLDDRAAAYDDIEDRYGMGEGDPYRPLVRTLVLAGDRVRSVHFNNPTTNDLPHLTSPERAPGLYTALDLMDENDVYTVLDPDADTLDDPSAVRKTVKRMEAASSGYR